jgi:hypothetical protein
MLRSSYFRFELQQEKCGDSHHKPLVRLIKPKDCWFAHLITQREFEGKEKKKHSFYFCLGTKRLMQHEVIKPKITTQKHSHRQNNPGTISNH